MAELFEAGDTIECLCCMARRDGRSEIKLGDRVNVLRADTFTHDGKKCQDLMVQRGNDMPIAVLVTPGRFRKIASESPAESLNPA